MFSCLERISCLVWCAFLSNRPRVLETRKLNTIHMFQACSSHVPVMFQACSRSVPGVFHACSRHVHFYISFLFLPSVIFQNHGFYRDISFPILNFVGILSILNTYNCTYICMYVHSCTYVWGCSQKFHFFKILPFRISFWKILKHIFESFGLSHMYCSFSYLVLRIFLVLPAKP